MLDTDKCLSSFQLSNTTILGEIRALLVPNVVNIRAELYKINVYTSPTGCFKPHVDTPRGSNMFGSLVVCLPTQFQGGALVARHCGEQVVYDWSSPSEDPVQKIQWAAFFSDIEHEILPVTEGYRVTLTYTTCTIVTRLVQSQTLLLPSTPVLNRQLVIRTFSVREGL